MTANNLITAKRRQTVIQSGIEASHYRGTNNEVSFRKAANRRKEVLVELARVGVATGAVLLIIKPKQLIRD